MESDDDEVFQSSVKRQSLNLHDWFGRNRWIDWFGFGRGRTEQLGAKIGQDGAAEFQK